MPYEKKDRRKWTRGTTIPQDWHEGDGWCMVRVCIPNSDGWRRTVKGTLSQLAMGRKWRGDGPRKADDPQAIEIIDAQEIGRLIYESICVNCNWEEQEKLKASLLKRLLATLSNGEIHHDAWYLENDPQRFTELDPTDPNYNTDPDAETVASVLIYDGTDLGISFGGQQINNWTLSQLLVDTQYAREPSWTPSIPSIGDVDGLRPMANIQYRAEVDLKHLNAKLSRTGEVPAELPDGGVLLPAYTNPSVFTYDRVKPFAENETITSGLIEALRADVTAGIGGIGGSYGTALAELFRLDPNPPVGSWFEVIINWFNDRLGFNVAGASIAELSAVMNSQFWTAFITKGLNDIDYSWLEKLFRLDQANANGDATITEVIDGKEMNVSATGGNATVNVDNTGVETQLALIVNALDSLEFAGTNNSTNIQQALDNVSQAVSDLEIINIANTGDNVKYNVKSTGCCDDTLPLPDGVPDGDGAYLPTIPKLDGPVKPVDFDTGQPTGDCIPTATNSLITVLDAFIGAIDYIEDTVGDEVAVWMAPPVLIFIAGTSTVVAGALEALNMVVPEPSDAGGIAVTALGAYITYLLIQLTLDIGLEGIKLTMGYIKYDYDFWQSWECNDATIIVNVWQIPNRAYDYVKSLGKSDELAEAVKGVMEDMLNSNLRWAFLKGKDAYDGIKDAIW